MAVLASRLGVGVGVGFVAVAIAVRPRRIVLQCRVSLRARPLAPAGSVPMVVMDVRRMIVGVHDARTHVRVGMRASDRRFVTMVVMVLVVSMRVRGRLMRVFVPVLLGDVQIRADREAASGDQRHHRGVAVAEHPRPESRPGRSGPPLRRVPHRRARRLVRSAATAAACPERGKVGTRSGFHRESRG